MKKTIRWVYTGFTLAFLAVGAVVCFLRIPGILEFQAGFLALRASKALLYLFIGYHIALLPLSLLVTRLQGKVGTLAVYGIFYLSVVNLLFIIYAVTKYMHVEVYWFVLLRVIAAILLGFLVFSLYPRLKISQKKGFRAVAVCLCVFFALLPLSEITPNRLYQTPVVYAVEDTYQIVWYTSADSTAWVTVGEETYYDTTGGAVRAAEKIHKVTVPMEKLDAAKAYTIGYQKILHRGAYFAIKGNAVTADYTFRPVDMADGLQLYHLSDTHSNNTAPATAAQYWEDKLDVLVLNGDIVSDNTRRQDLRVVLELASKITRGNVPVIYARGNHETRGAYTEMFHRYVGCKDADTYYYTVRLGSAWFLVLDLAEDKPDSHAEYAGFADYQRYREKETAFVEDTFAEEEYLADGIDYRLLVCHVPVSNKNDTYAGITTTWIALTEKMGIDLQLGGHAHATEFQEPLAQETDLAYAHMYPVVIGSRAWDGKTEEPELPRSVFTGTALRLADDGIDILFTNQNRERVLEAHHVTAGS